MSVRVSGAWGKWQIPRDTAFAAFVAAWCRSRSCWARPASPARARPRNRRLLRLPLPGRASRTRPSSQVSSSRRSWRSHPTGACSSARRAASSRSSTTCRTRRRACSPTSAPTSTTPGTEAWWGWRSTRRSRPSRTCTSCTRTTPPSAELRRGLAFPGRRRTTAPRPTPGACPAGGCPDSRRRGTRWWGVSRCSSRTGVTSSPTPSER